MKQAKECINTSFTKAMAAVAAPTGIGNLSNDVIVTNVTLKKPKETDDKQVEGGPVYTGAKMIVHVVFSTKTHHVADLHNFIRALKKQHRVKGWGDALEKLASNHTIELDIGTCLSAEDGP